jgi:hypothetical protein
MAWLNFITVVTSSTYIRELHTGDIVWFTKAHNYKIGQVVGIQQDSGDIIIMRIISTRVK